MKSRGQTPESWCARWRVGSCPVHGQGLSAVDGPLTRNKGDDGVPLACTKDECTVRAMRWKGKDKFHSFLGWVDGPDEIKAILVRAADIVDDGPRPGIQARSVRTAWPVGEGTF